MLILTFQVGSHRFALDVRRIREVVPRVPLRQPAGGAPWLAGVFVYRGQVVPVLDLHRLLGAGDCPLHLSSRIILVPTAESKLLGLLAAQVAEIRELPSPPAQPGDDLDGFGTMVVEQGGILHLVDLDRLLLQIGREMVPTPTRELKA